MSTFTPDPRSWAASVHCDGSCGLRLEVKPYNIRTTVISPGAMKTELADSITEPDIADGVRKFTDMLSVTAETFANIVSFASSQPEDVDINEILFRPTRQEL
jgi:NADP-dependent 3-hydroxy acid dehydrogenase YdfG